MKRRFLISLPFLLTAAAAARAQELTAPAPGLTIHWRAPAAPTMTTVVWTASAVEGPVATVRTEARTALDRITTEGSVYRVLFPLRSVDPYGTIYEFEYDRSAADAIGRLDAGKQIRLAVNSVSTITHPQTKQLVRSEHSGFTLITVEKHETIEMPAGKFETIVLRIEGDGGVRQSPGITQMHRRYWYAPALGWYVRHELLMTAPGYRLHNEYVAMKITRPDASTRRR
jgi:hypothetical protein